MRCFLLQQQVFQLYFFLRFRLRFGFELLYLDRHAFLNHSCLMHFTADWLEKRINFRLRLKLCTHFTGTKVIYIAGPMLTNLIQ